MLFVESELPMTVSYAIGGTWRKPAGGIIEYKQTCTFKGNFNAECAVRPPSNRVAAIPDEASASAIFPCAPLQWIRWRFECWQFHFAISTTHTSRFTWKFVCSTMYTSHRHSTNKRPCSL